MPLDLSHFKESIRPALVFAAILFALLAITKFQPLSPPDPSSAELHTCASLNRVPTSQLSEVDVYRLRVCQAENRLAVVSPK